MADTAGQSLVVEDLEAMDSMMVQQLNAIRNCHKDGIHDQSTFDSNYGQMRYTYTGSDGEDRELLLGGQ